MTSPHTPLPLQPDWTSRLRGVPSYHFDPIFAQRVQRALTEFAPDCVALEIPHTALPELLWAVEQWPSPCASIGSHAVFPFVPGDSILEAARIASQSGIAIEAVDREIGESEWPFANHSVPTHEEEYLRMPDSQWADRFSESWDAALDALLPPPSPSDAARESHMASRLSHLLALGHKVVWVGGAAHWTRILSRLQNGDFQSPAPSQNTSTSQGFQRARLKASSLFFLSGRLPQQTAGYADDPENYSESKMLSGAVAHALAGGDEDSTAPRLVVNPANDLHSDPIFELLQQESCTAANAASVLSYARNLAATKGLRTNPSVAQLLRAAVMVIGPRYGGRLYHILTQEEKHAAHNLNGLPSLTYEVRGQRHGLWLGDQAVSVRPYWPTPEAGNALQLLKPRQQDAPSYSSPDRARTERTSWLCHPEDRRCYRDFVRSVFRIAAQQALPEEKAIPFSSGLAEGIDVRATLRGAYNEEIWVRETTSAPLHITNAAIDWGNSTEFCPLLQGKQREHGWIDPSEFFGMGSCSRTGPTKMLSHDPHVQLDQRFWTLLTLDLGTTASEKDQPSFYDKVIQPLVDLQSQSPYRDDVYHWLDIMFRFCARKPLAYISHYKPSGKIYRIAARHRVTVIHVPLAKIPTTLRARNEYFRFMTVPIDLWRQVMQHNYSNKI